MTGLPNHLQTHEAERLSLIRYQLMIAEQQAQQPSPLSSLALGTMQDAVESMLSLVVEREHITTAKRNDFLQLLDSVAGWVQGTPPISGFRPAAAAMNLARVNFKHHGNQAESNTITRHLGNSKELVDELARRVFGVALESISLLLFVQNEQVRDHLGKAQSEWGAGDCAEAMQQMRLAFDRLIQDYEQRKSWHPGKSLFSTKPSFLPSVFDLRGAGREIEKAFEWLESLDRWVKMVALGIDMRRYAFFEAYAPLATYTLGGEVYFHQRDGISPTENDFGRCFKFIVDTALAFARDDFDFDAWSARRAAHAEGVEV